MDLRFQFIDSELEYIQRSKRIEEDEVEEAETRNCDFNFGNPFFLVREL